MAPLKRLCDFASVSVEGDRVPVEGGLDALSAPLLTTFLNSPTRCICDVRSTVFLE
jgi:hypothetical protein